MKLEDLLGKIGSKEFKEKAKKTQKIIDEKIELIKKREVCKGCLRPIAPLDGEHILFYVLDANFTHHKGTCAVAVEWDKEKIGKDDLYSVLSSIFGIEGVTITSEMEVTTDKNKIAYLFSIKRTKDIGFSNTDDISGI